MGFLYEELRRKAPALAHDLDRVREEALAIWREPRLLAMTEHGEPHLKQVERNLDQLSQPFDQQGLSLSPEEIYVLLAACYLHDIGMQLGVPDAREQHAQYSYELILNSKETAGASLNVRLSIQDDNARESIAEVARAHWASFAVKLPETRFLYGNQEGRIGLLGALLAMADLLDLSPVRARYYRTPHRLQELPATSDLHQRKHGLVRGFRIAALPADLQVQIEWRGNSEQVQMISDWVLHETTSYWRQVEPLLYQRSSGRIRWANPWARASFFPPLGPPQPLSRDAERALRALRREQLRIDRDELCQGFLDAIQGDKRILFLLPNEREGDAARLSEWCHAQASSRTNLRVAKLHVQGIAAPDPAGLVAELFEQWGLHLPDVPEQEALRRLHEELSIARGSGVVTVLVAEEYSPRLLDKLLRDLFTRSAADSTPRLCALFTPHAAGPDNIDGVEIRRLLWSEVSEADLESHLQTSWGYNEAEARRWAADSLPLRRSAGYLYDHVEKLGKSWQNDF